jgi:hypothetical protein
VIISDDPPKVTGPGSVPHEVTSSAGEVVYRSGEPFPMHLLPVRSDRKNPQGNSRGVTAEAPGDSSGRSASPQSAGARPAGPAAAKADENEKPAAPLPTVIVSALEVERFSQTLLEATSERMLSMVRPIIEHEIDEDNWFRDAEERGLTGGR